jgi:uncharacterized membrane protein
MLDRIDRFGFAVQRHWLAVIVGILFVYSLLPFGAPILKKAGLNGLSQVIYQPYKLMCHTYSFRSFFMFGAQPTYSRSEFEQATGIDTGSFSGLLAARDFQGNEELGYKVALCQRDVAIYLAMAVNGMIYAVVRGRRRPLPWLVFLMIALVPIALDGFSQLLCQPPFNFIPFRESTPFLRIATGALFGFGVAWLVFPLMDGTMFPSPAKPVNTARPPDGEGGVEVQSAPTGK